MKKAIFAGSFDPIHEGHLSIIKKSLKLFDWVFVVVSFNPEKKSNTSFEKRSKLVQEHVAGLKRISVIINKDEMTAHLAKKLDAKWLIRSGRNNIDYQYELEIAAGCNHLNHELETVLIIPDYKNIDFASRLIKQTKK